MGIAYLHGIRQTDLRLVKGEQITVDHNRKPVLRIVESKTGKANEHEITPTVLLMLNGLAWTEWGLQSALRRFDAGFQFRQPRPKAQTDRP